MKRKKDPEIEKKKEYLRGYECNAAAGGAAVQRGSRPPPERGKYGGSNRDNEAGPQGRSTCMFHFNCGHRISGFGCMPYIGD